MAKTGGATDRQLLQKLEKLTEELEESRRKEADLSRQLQLAQRRREEDCSDQISHRTSSERDFERSSIPKAESKSWFFCPARRPKHEATEASAQDICWQLLTSMQDVNAVQCNIDDLVITASSKGACKTWGSSALNGKSLESLFNGSQAPKALLEYQKLAANRQSGSVGFAVKSLFHEEFKNKQGTAFEASVLVAMMPSDPRLHRPGKLLVIIDHNEEKMRMEEEKVAEKKRGKHEASNIRPTANSKNQKFGRKISDSKEDQEAVKALQRTWFTALANDVTDIVIAIDATMIICETKDAKELCKQQDIFGEVLSGHKFDEKFLDQSSLEEFQQILREASETSLPRAMRATVKHQSRLDSDADTKEATLMLMDTGDDVFMVGIRLEGDRGESLFFSEEMHERHDSGNLANNLEAIKQLTEQRQASVAKDVKAMSVAASEGSSHYPQPSTATGHTALQRKHEGFGGGVWRVVPAFGLGIGDYTQVKIVGIGGQGAVYQVKDQAGCLFALKKVNLPGCLWQRDFPAHLRNADREARVLKSLAWASAVIVRVHDCWIQDDFKYACIVMEWMYGSLATHLKERKDRSEPVPLKDTCRWLTHMATGLAIIHEAGFMHRDVKPQNILLTEDLHWCKIADLGLGRAVHEEPLAADQSADALIPGLLTTAQPRGRSRVSQAIDADNASQVSQGTSVVVKSVLSGYTEFAGTKDYMSPEADEGGQYNTATDVFSLGCVLFELLSSVSGSGTLSSHMRNNKAMAGVEASWSASCAMEDAKAQLEKLIPRIKDEEKDTFKELSTLCTGMLTQNYAQRPTARNILSADILRPGIKDLLDYTDEEKLRKFLANVPQRIGYADVASMSSGSFSDSR